jgi:hypothetical protein
VIVRLRCRLDGLLLDAIVGDDIPVTAYDGGDAFGLEPVEAIFYEIVSADMTELLGLELAHYRLLRRAADFVLTGA